MYQVYVYVISYENEQTAVARLSSCESKCQINKLPSLIEIHIRASANVLR